MSVRLVDMGRMLVWFVVTVGKVIHHPVPSDDFPTLFDRREDCTKVLPGSSSFLVPSKIELAKGQLILSSAVVYYREEIPRSDTDSVEQGMTRNCK